MHWLPNFFIAGAPKAGTSSIHQWIADHPDAFGSVEKETYFMVDPGTHMFRKSAHISQGLESWEHQFPLPESQTPRVIIESTPGYIYYQTALDNIPKLPTKPKCLFVLREPSQQIYSLFSYFKSNWNWIPADMSFSEFIEACRNKSHSFKGNELAVNALENVRYVDFLRQWKEKLGADNIKVLSFDQLKDDPVGLVKEVAEWIGLDPSFYDTYDFPRENESYVPVNHKLQSVNVAIRSKLPKGKIYNWLRSIYRKLNTKKGHVEKSFDDQHNLDLLKQEFASANAELAKEFGIQFR